MANFQPLNKDTHANVKIAPQTQVEDLRSQHALGVVVHEFALAGAHYPVAFVKDEKNDAYFPVVMLGLEQGKNLFVTEEGKWTGLYMPARYTHKPLTVIPSQENPNQFGIAIDMDAETVNEEEGDALFTESGEESEMLKTRKEAIVKYVEHEQITKAFLDQLDSFDLLKPQNLTVKVSGKEFALNGLYLVDEEKLNGLSDEDYLTLRKRGFLAPIYAHLGSMHKVTALIEKQAALQA